MAPCCGKINQHSVFEEKREHGYVHSSDLICKCLWLQTLTPVLVCVWTDSFYDTFHTTADVMYFCQMMAVLEVINPLLGLVKTGFFPALIQVWPCRLRLNSWDVRGAGVFQHSHLSCDILLLDFRAQVQLMRNEPTAWSCFAVGVGSFWCFAPNSSTLSLHQLWSYFHFQIFINSPELSSLLHRQDHLNLLVDPRGRAVL